MSTPQSSMNRQPVDFGKRLAHTLRMAGTTTETDTPTFQLRHRLALAIECAGVEKEDMATYIGVSRQTVDNYLKGRTQPTIGYIRNWADRCQVSVNWLLTGHADTESDTRDYRDGNALPLAA